MNISQPITSSVEAVKFSFLSSDEIKNLSVKRIINPTTFDNLLHPNPGGLYDPALGAILDNPCSTCHLNLHSCPGHCGHIELPVYAYHCLFLDQTYRLFRAQCVHCRRFKMARVEVDRYCCKIRLINHGLLEEAEALEDVGMQRKSLGAGEDIAVADVDTSESEDEKTKSLMSQRRSFVKSCLKKQQEGSQERSHSLFDHSEAVSAARQAVIKEFQIEMLKPRKCASCKGISPRYRKNKSNSIFRRPINSKDQAKNVEAGIKRADNPLAVLNRQTKDQDRKLSKVRQKQINRLHPDEGVADLDDSSTNEELVEGDIFDDATENMEEESEDQSSAGEEVGGSVLHTEATNARPDKRKKKHDTQQQYVNQNEVHASISLLFDKERDIISQIYNSGSQANLQPSADMFFIRYLLVPPNKYRKEQKTGLDEISESPDNESYRQILNECNEIYEIQRGIANTGDSNGSVARDFDDLQRAWLRLQDMVNSLIDKDKNPARGPLALRIPEGIKQKLEKKEGMFRMNIMGKRVNFAARSVISPDPNIDTNEIGIPPVFAKKLTYPEPVTAYNFDVLKQAVMNGPTKWPGAAAIEYENGQIINLRHKTGDELQALANLLLAPSTAVMTGIRNKKVHRHLVDGDLVLMNRQPTLHKPSMMAHSARVLPGEKTIRLHYTNCNAYNADFDGDEMNLHFPQNEIARAEALQIAGTDYQYLSATFGDPLRGLIQDHITISVWLTCKDMFFSREEYHELLYASLKAEGFDTTSERIITAEPTLLKPKQLWTGKQVISTVLLNITPGSHDGLTLNSKSAIPADRWDEGSQEGNVIFSKGEFCSGILDKQQIGPKSGGFVHAVYEVYGHVIAGRLLSILGRLLTKLLNMRAFSCGVEDLLLTETGEHAREDTIVKAEMLGLESASKYVSPQSESFQSNDPELLERLEAVLRDEEKQSGLDTSMNQKTSELSSKITKVCLPGGLLKPFPKNQMQTMTVSGAKGTLVNVNLICCNLGQQNLEGRRVPTMISGKTLPSFKAFDTSYRAGGYIVDRFLTGVKPQEYFFHAMAGREGLVDTAVKTSRSGYLQRCLVKGMEGLRVDYDTSVRDADGTIIQSLYGEDGLDITKQKSLMDFNFVAQNLLSFMASLNVRHEIEKVLNPDAQDWNKKAIKLVRKYCTKIDFDPALSRFSQTRFSGSTSEKYYEAARVYMDVNPEQLLKPKKAQLEQLTRSQAQSITDRHSRSFFESVLGVHYMKATVEAGEAVGIVAAQSLGEPSTQMTLNTFHLAGHAAKNVTLGIPRLREILMTASVKIKTPLMTLYLIPEMSRADGEKFVKGISPYSLADVLTRTAVKERTGAGIFPESTIYNIQLEFYPPEECLQEYGVTELDVAHAVEFEFLPRLRKALKRELRIRRQGNSLKTVSQSVSNSDAQPDIGQSVGMDREDVRVTEDQNEGGDSDINDDGDDDATTAKRKSNLDEGTTYEDPEDDEEQILASADDDVDAEVEAPSEDETYGGSPRETEDSVSDREEGVEKSSRADLRDRESRVKSNNQDITGFTFDDRNGLYCSIELQYESTTAKILLLAIVNREAKNAYIQSVPEIRSAVLTTEKATGLGNSDALVVTTAGANLLVMRQFQDIIDPNRMLTNDIGAMLRLYGVEACRETIVRELSSVFYGHNIKVDTRHLTLVADYMTRGGGFLPFSRHGMSDKRSPFAKMSFETTLGFLRDAVLDGDTDDLRNPSARITVGKLTRMGTGMFDVFMPLPA